jgi:hypothetical protein
MLLRSLREAMTLFPWTAAGAGGFVLLQARAVLRRTAMEMRVSRRFMIPPEIKKAQRQDARIHDTG